MQFPEITSIYEPSGFSFPSGHVFMAFITVLPLIVTITTKDNEGMSPIQKKIVGIILISYAVLMSLSRLILGVHFLSDILFSIGMAIIFNLFISAILKTMIEKRIINSKNEIIFGGLWSLA